MKLKLFFLLSVIGVFAGGVFAEEPAALMVQQIVQKANHAAYYQGLDGKSKVTMVIADKQDRQRNREFIILRKNSDEKDTDQKYYVYFLAPADVRKMVFMVHKHIAVDSDDDRWLYLPNLDLVKRIAAGDKRTSFVGSDFLYEDVSGRSLNEDIHVLTDTTDRFYVVKNTPKNPESVEFAYYTVFIDKKTFMPMKMEYYDRNDMLYRTIESVKVEEIKAQSDGVEVSYPTVTESVVKDLKTGSTTTMTFSEIQYNIGLTDDLFTERYLRRPPREAMR
ncbi:MAG: outer membrane lipoprotein-sorting protein [Phycisphaerae bacterium]|nr:outer membrane lipoprotein-sorting protein [Phycisphaerae bacterium]